MSLAWPLDDVATYHSNKADHNIRRTRVLSAETSEDALNATYQIQPIYSQTLSALPQSWSLYR